MCGCVGVWGFVCGRSPRQGERVETAVTFEREGARRVGVLHLPETRVGETGVVFLHGWSGCRLGPHRMFVTCARRLCATGVPCLRFDFGGRGDSEGEWDTADIAQMRNSYTTIIKNA